jgi:protease-4
MRRLSLALAVALLTPLLALRADDPKPDKTTEKKTDEKTKTIVPVFRLKGSLAEAGGDDGLLFGANTLTLKDLVERLKKAAEDKDVKAVVLLPEGGVGSAQTEEVRQAIAKLRAAGKDVFVHADSLTMREYLLACGANRVSIVPTGELWLTGTYAESPYVRGLLDLLGIKPDFLTCGEYKSAGEIFMRTGPSPEAERMQNWLLDSIFATSVKLIAKGRGVDETKAKDWVDNGPYTAAKAKEAGLIDAVEHRQDFEAMLRDKYGKDLVLERKYGKKKEPKVDFTSPLAFFKLFSDLMAEGKKKKTGKDAIAIVYVDGAIVTGGGGTPSILGGKEAGSTDIRKALDEAARDESVKAVVLRVDSPGGSAVASEIILDATRRVKAKKPFVVSMGDVAGSGGYYVTCAADTVFADEATITGSIGVVSGKFATNDMWKKVGITFKAYQRGKNSGLLASDHVFTPEERAKMQGYMDEIYEVFKGHVVAARGAKLKKPIDELAGGRVYTGKQALELGLVDKIGTLEDAIKHVAAQAKLTDYDVRIIPPTKNFLEQLVEEMSGDKDQPNHLRLGGKEQVSLVELALPHLKGLDPERVRLIQMALRRMELTQREGVMLMMPELRIGR